LSLRKSFGETTMPILKSYIKGIYEDEPTCFSNVMANLINLQSNSLAKWPIQVFD